MNIVNVVKTGKCIGCGVCSLVCPNKCIHMVLDNHGFSNPQINNCSDCGLCIKKCPVANSDSTSSRIPIKSLAAYSLDNSIVLSSSSGGIFTLLAREVINHGGYVVGAVFTKDFSVQHKIITNVDEIRSLNGSKYIQSDITFVLPIIKKKLIENKTVLFSGTPCQIVALNLYLGNKFKKLITVDVICHGVPSFKVWEKYLKEQYQEFGDGIQANEVSFRYKPEGEWEKYGMLLRYKTRDIFNNRSEDVFFKCFLSNICLRPSCYKCLFKDGRSGSDITLGDFWGIRGVDSRSYNHLGTSLVIINTMTGEKLFNDCSKEMFVRQVDFDKAININKNWKYPCKKHRNYDAFFNNLDKEQLNIIIKTLDKKSHSEIILEKIHLSVYMIVKNLGLVPILKKILNK